MNLLLQPLIGAFWKLFKNHDLVLSYLPIGGFGLHFIEVISGAVLKKRKRGEMVTLFYFMQFKLVILEKYPLYIGGEGGGGYERHYPISEVNIMLHL